MSLMLLSVENTSGQSQVVGLTAIMLGLSTSLASYYFGKDAMTWIRSVHDKSGKSSHQQNDPPASTCPIFSVSLALLLVMFALLACLLVDNTMLLKVSLCGIFAPFGASLRYFLSKLNQYHHMPLGTMSANILGSTLIALIHVLTSRLILDSVQSTVMSAISSGFLACLTTVSTFMSEAASRRDKGQYFESNIYVITTLILCQLLGAIINGINKFVPK